MATLEGRTLFITGASRGIGLAIALRAARDGANIVIAAKTTEPHPRLPGTIHSAAKEVERAGGHALPVPCDIRFEDQIDAAVESAVAAFGGIDILVNNAGAIDLTGTEEMSVKRYDLMHQVNARGTFLCGRACIPFLRRATNPHILTLSPPLSLESRWFAPHLAYTMSKFGMSMCVLGWSEELAADGIAANALWPRTAIDTAAVRNLLGGEDVARRSRRADIVADAAHVILTAPSRSTSGNFFIDEQVLRDAGIRDFARYAVDPGQPLVDDFFV